MAGQGYEAKFYGKVVPLQGDPDWTRIFLKRVGFGRFRKPMVAGKMVDISTILISPDEP